jgi:hypothetical protein
VDREKLAEVEGFTVPELTGESEKFPDDVIWLVSVCAELADSIGEPEKPAVVEDENVVIPERETFPLLDADPLLIPLLDGEKVWLWLEEGDGEDSIVALTRGLGLQEAERQARGVLVRTDVTEGF